MNLRPLVRWMLIATAILAGALPTPAMSQGATSHSGKMTLDDLLRDGRRHTWMETVSALVRNSESAFPSHLLFRALRHPNPTVRRLAAYHLGDVSAPDANMVHRLVQALADKDEVTALQAVASLGRIGRINSKLLEPYLEDFQIKRRRWSFRHEGRSPFWDISGTWDLTTADVVLTNWSYARADISPIIDAYRRALSRNPQNHRNRKTEHNWLPTKPGSPEYYLGALRHILWSSKPRTDQVTELLKAPDFGLRDIGYKLASKAGVEADDLVSLLLQGVESGPTDEDRESAARTLVQIKKSALLEPLLSVFNASTRIAAFKALLTAPTCDDPTVMEWIVDPDPSVRSAAATSLPISAMLCTRKLIEAPDLTPQAYLNLLKYFLRSVEDGTEVSEADTDRRLSVIVPFLTHDDLAVRQAAWAAVAFVAGNHAITRRDILDPLREDLRHQPDERRGEAICAVLKLEKSLWQSDGQFVASLADAYERLTNTVVRNCAIRALNSLDPQPLRRAFPLTRLLSIARSKHSLSEEERDLVARALGPRALSKYRYELLKGKELSNQLEIALWLSGRGLTIAALPKSEKSQATGRGRSRDNARLRYDGETEKPNRKQITFLARTIVGQGASPEASALVLKSFFYLGKTLQRLFVPNAITASYSTSPVRRVGAADALWQLSWDDSSLNDHLLRLARDDDERVVSAAVDTHTIGLGINGCGGRAHAMARTKFVQAFNWRDLRHFLRMKNPRLRALICEGFEKLVRQLPPSELENTSLRLLADRDADVREDALSVMRGLGSQAIPILRKALLGPHANSLLASLARWSDDNALYVEMLKEISRRRLDLRARILPILAKFAKDDPGIVRLVSASIASDQSALRRAAVDAQLSWYDDPQTLAPSALALILEEDVAKAFASRLASALTSFYPRPPRDRVIITTGSGPEELPDFPWPPPAWSDNVIVPKALLGGDEATLNDVKRVLVSSIEKASIDYRWSVFGNVPGGYALLARVEHIRADGRRLDGPDGWSERDQPIASAREFLVNLFMSPPGYYRVIAFIITDQSTFSPGTGKLPRESEGAKELPDSIARLTMKNRECFALIYTYRRFPGGKVAFGYDSDPGGKAHLIQAGIWSNLAHAESTAKENQ